MVKTPGYDVLGRFAAGSTERIEIQSNKIERSHPLPACCISKAIVMKSAEIIFLKVYVSPRPPPKISYKDNWTCELDSDIAGGSEDSQRIELKTNTQLSSSGRVVSKWSEETLERTKFDRDTLNQEKHDNATDPTSTGRPVKMEEHDIDFRAPGLSYAVVKEAEHFRVQELVKKIENHPHREALQAYLQQNNAYNPFSKNSKEMIRELGNVELLELCETTPKVQCFQCLLYWNQGIVYCTCGQCLIDSESRRKFNKL